MAEHVEDAVTEYVVGFAFDWDGRVALIRKNRPEWQAGRLNGIGGHVEQGERPDDAMEREFWEETATRLTAWERFVVMDFPGARIHFYRLLDLDPRVLDGLITATDEQVCPTGANIVADALLASGAVIDAATLADDEAAETAYWRESEAGNTKRDRGGYYHDGFIDGFRALAAALQDPAAGEAGDA